MTDREMNAIVAERVMGLKVVGWATCYNADGSLGVDLDSKPEDWTCAAWHGPVYQAGEDLWADDEDRPKLGGVTENALEPVPHYTTDAAADYTVLEKVRAEWDREKAWAFADALIAMHDSRSHAILGSGCRTLYEIGDYAKSSLMALGD